MGDSSAGKGNDPPNPLTENVCLNCKNTFHPKNTNQSYCSSACFSAMLDERNKKAKKRNSENISPQANASSKLKITPTPRSPDKLPPTSPKALDQPDPDLFDSSDPIPFNLDPDLMTPSELLAELKLRIEIDLHKDAKIRKLSKKIANLQQEAIDLKVICANKDLIILSLNKTAAPKDLSTPSNAPQSSKHSSRKPIIHKKALSLPVTEDLDVPEDLDGKEEPFFTVTRRNRRKLSVTQPSQQNLPVYPTFKTYPPDRHRPSKTFDHRQLNFKKVIRIAC